MKKIIFIYFFITLATFSNAKAEYKFNFIIHSDTNADFWAIVYKGFKDACLQVDADCTMLTLSDKKSQYEQLKNLESSIYKDVDGIITTITDSTLFDKTIDKALAAGIPVISANTDDPEGELGSNRLAFIGQDLEKAGYKLAETLSNQFPDDNIHILIGVADSKLSWARKRASGIIKFLEFYKLANPEKEITYEKIESGTDSLTVGKRVSEYIKNNPNTTAYIDVGFWEVGVAEAIRNIGYMPGQILLAGFDLFDIVLEEMEKGYVQLTVDQQPYYQGYMAVHQLYLMNKYGLKALNIDTGMSIISPEDIPTIRLFNEMLVN